MPGISDTSSLPPPIVVRCTDAPVEDLLEKEWLLPNNIGAYASSTVLGCNTRCYHGLLVATATPPVGRSVALATVMEQLLVGETAHDLATNEFVGAFSPQGWNYLVEFRNDVAPTFVYRFGDLELVKEIMLAQTSNAVGIRYTLRGGSAELLVWPFAAMRDFHYRRRVHEPQQMTFSQAPGGVTIEDRLAPGQAMHLVSRDGRFDARPQWWYRFRYRADIARGNEGLEDLYTPGMFVLSLEDGKSCQLTASMRDPVPMGFHTAVSQRATRLSRLAAALGPGADEFEKRLAVAADAFVVQRSFPASPSSATILAGYHWFADWGRDAFIALPGLLLETGQLGLAKQVFRTFASSIDKGIVPNRFDDYSYSAHYNSIDASLWFLLAAERYVEASGDDAFLRDTFLPAAEAILTAYHDGTSFDIHAGSDGLLLGGSHRTQLTWMDAALGEEIVTPRHGAAVEVNALWHCLHHIVARRAAGINNRLADRCAALAATIGPAFVRAFWNDSLGCLFDCVVGDWKDGSLRPNQVFAVSLPHSPLSHEQQQGVMKAVTDRLLTPYGLRSLSPDDGRYRRRYGGSMESRDRAYHQGTVWAWLIGPYIEALLRVGGQRGLVVQQARSCLAPLEAHLKDAGLGYVSEIFDGDPPHAPRGCIAQAWSVGEVLRAKRLVDRYEVQSRARQ